MNCWSSSRASLCWAPRGRCGSLPGSQAALPSTRCGPTVSWPPSIPRPCHAPRFRIALFAVVGFALLRPVLLLKVAVPQRDFVGILLDDSRSMQIADQDGKPRSEFLISQLGRPDAALLTELGKRFQVKVFRFSSAAERLRSAADLTFQGTGTHRRGVRPRASGAERVAGRRTGSRHRRLGQRADAEQVDCRAQIPGDAGVCDRHRPRPADARSPDHRGSKPHAARSRVPRSSSTSSSPRRATPA